MIGILIGVDIYIHLYYFGTRLVSILTIYSCFRKLEP